MITLIVHTVLRLNATADDEFHSTALCSVLSLSCASARTQTTLRLAENRPIRRSPVICKECRVTELRRSKVEGDGRTLDLLQSLFPVSLLR